MDLRACYKPSTNDTGCGLDPNKQGLRVKIRHPGYPDDGRQNLLLDLLASDPPDGGLHHGTAWTACCVVACNRWDGYLSTSKGPEGRVQMPLDTILAAGTYYFLLPTGFDSNGDELPYPICPSFRDWRFPHDNLPPMWSDYSHEPSNTTISVNNTTQQKDSVRRRDGTCRVSDSTKGLEVAHIIPTGEDSWFASNYMTVFNTDNHRNKTVTNVSNMLLLRSDLHTVYDAHEWAIVPKESRADEGKPKPVFHQLKQSDELSQLYHNKKIHCISGVSIEYLLSRFAFAIFPELEPFLRGGRPRWLTKVTADSSQVTEWCTWANLVAHNFARTNRERSNSPQKRDLRGNRTPAAEKTSHKRKYEAYDSDDCEGLEMSSSSASHLYPKRIKCTASSPIETTFAVKSSQQPCTCKEEEPLQTPANSSCPSAASCIVPDKGKVQIPCQSSACRVKAEWDRHTALIESFLTAERAKSETGEKWKQEQEWAAEAIKGGMTQETLRKWFWVMGNDNYMEDDSLEFVDEEESGGRGGDLEDTCAVIV